MLATLEFLVSWCLPRASGGVSTTDRSSRSNCGSSPRKRGCFLRRRRWLEHLSVFPAQAGVFLGQVDPMREAPSLPRASGGVSVAGPRRAACATSSPRKRGCFRHVWTVPDEQRVFPAQAGVFLYPGSLMMIHGGLPRASGGVSRKRPRRRRPCESSPRKRGCFQDAWIYVSDEQVFPAQAGVFPRTISTRTRVQGLPRASGVFLEGVSGELGMPLDAVSRYA